VQIALRQANACGMERLVQHKLLAVLQSVVRP
jgi:hypothetical protein